MKIIKNLIFLASPHPVSKGYFSAMKHLGLIPERIIYLDLDYYHLNELKENTGLLRKLRSYFLSRNSVGLMSSKKQEMIAFNSILASLFELCSKNILNFDFFDKSMRVLLDEMNYGYEVIKLKSINDEVFLNLISSAPQKFALYVEGGILRANILDSHVKFIHIHPGIVPDVRGTMCLLWGAFVNRKIGGSCFFMDKGIDTGNVIFQKEYPVPQIPIESVYLSAEYFDIRLKIIEDYIDPIIRADILQSLLKKNSDISSWESWVQKDGKQYYYPHPLILEKLVSQFYLPKNLES